MTEQPNVNRMTGIPVPTVCVVDGDAGVREGLKSLLGTLGLRVATFRSAEELLDCVERHRPQCIITEVQLPGMSGLDLQRRLVASAPDVPVIVLAANADVPMAVRAMHLGAIDFIEKPFIARIVVARVCEALGVTA
jgi:FixJ family two-component response regulator